MAHPHASKPNLSTSPLQWDCSNVYDWGHIFKNYVINSPVFYCSVMAIIQRMFQVLSVMHLRKRLVFKFQSL